MAADRRVGAMVKRVDGGLRGHGDRRGRSGSMTVVFVGCTVTGDERTAIRIVDQTNVVFTGNRIVSKP